jgi:hypothetical protein
MFPLLASSTANVHASCLLLLLVQRQAAVAAASPAPVVIHHLAEDVPAVAEHAA